MDTKTDYNIDYKIKYLKYKIKYNKILKEQYGGSKQIAKEISDFVHSTNIFNDELVKLSSSIPLEFMFNIYISGEIERKNIKQLLESLKIKFPFKKFYHNIIRKNIETTEMINDIIEKKYSNNVEQCTASTGSNLVQKSINYPHSGMFTNKNKYFINKLPNIAELPDSSTYNYVLLFVTDMNTNQTYYYFVFVKYTTYFEYSIKHSNLRVFLPDEWLNNVNIDYGLIASGELKIDTIQKKIIFDFNSSSMIIKMFISPEEAAYKPNYIKTNFITDYIDFTISLVNQEQLLAITYIFISNHMVTYSIKKIIELEPTYSEYTVEIHSDYKDRTKLLIAAGNRPDLIYTRGVYYDPYPYKLGGLHNYGNKECYTLQELIEFNTASAREYQDLDDNNIEKINCIKNQNGSVPVRTSDIKKNNDFIKKCNKLMAI